MKDFILDEMIELEADGVDFVPIFTTPENIYMASFCKSYTKEQWIASDGSYPKSGRLYWKMVNGKKEYIE